MTARTWAFVFFLSVVFCTTPGAQPLDTRCVADGGIAICTEPTNVASPANAAADTDMWTYNVCDFAGAFAWRSAAWVTALGGRPLFDADIVPVSTTFERIVNNACQITVTDSGWGYTIPYNILCWSGGPLARNQSLIRDFRKLTFSGLTPTATGCNGPWTEVVYAGKWRGVACPKTYNTRTKANGDLECWKFPPECPPTVGNPVNLLDGCKLQRELDYRSRTPGGLEVERFYNSGGHFRFEVSPERSSDVWRTTWDRRIVAPLVPGAVLAYAQRADGAVHVFLPSGGELHNSRGGGSARLQRLADAAGATTGWRLTTAGNDVEIYDASGRLQTVTLRAGWTYTLAYGTNEKLATVTDILGNKLTFTYDPSGRRSGFVAPGSRVYVYSYDAKDRLVSVTYPDGTVRIYHYEDVNFVHGLTGITDENGSRFVTWTYDSSGRATSSQHAGGVEAVTLYYNNFSVTANDGRTIVVDAFGATRTYNYTIAGGMARVRIASDASGSTSSTFDSNGNLATYRDANANQTTYAYDLGRNLEISRTEAYGTPLARTITTQWHPVHRLPVRITAPSGVAGVLEVTDFVYDAQGNLLQKTITAGASVRRWNMTYNAFGQTLTADGPRTDIADVTTYTYYDWADPCSPCRGNVRTTTNAAGHVTTFEAYDADGQPTRVVDANGVVTTSSYDVRGRLRVRTLNAGGPNAETVAFDHDGAGQLIRTTMADGSVLRYYYDAAHRLTEIADGSGNVVQYTLDAMGNRIKEDVFDPSDRLQRTQRRVYDLSNRLYSDIGAAGQKSVYAYDANGNLKTTTDPLGRKTTRNYDARSRLLNVTDAGGGVTRYGYDAKDRLATVQDPLNLTTTYTYDGLGNQTRLASPDTGISTYVPDAAGNIVGSTDARGVATSHVYDGLGRQTSATFSGGAVAFEYDNTTVGGPYARGRLTRMTDPSGSTSYLYDALGRVVRKTQTVGTDATARTFATSYQYSSGRLTGITYPSGRNLSYAFDAQGRVTGITMAGQSVLGGAMYFPFGPVQGWTWASGKIYQRTYDPDGRVSTVTTGPDSAPFGAGGWNFGYDSLDRLTAATLPQGDSFVYAYDSNGNRKQETRAGAVTNYGYFAASNRLQNLTGAAARTFVYDAAGNLTNHGSLILTYDGRGRLSQVSNGYRYAINGMGQRVSKSGPGGTTHFVYDEPGRLIGEYDASGAVRQELVYLADTPVASVRPAADGGVGIYPIYTDHLDAPRLITNAADRIVWEWPLDTFGATPANDNPNGLGTFSFNLRFPGQYYDAETGLHYNYFRDYDPSVGRYVESDPIGLRGGINTYTYVRANPIDDSDPLGLLGSRGSTLPGCGTGWNRSLVPEPFGIRDCCAAHDGCYDDCERRPSRDSCDNDFCSCLIKKCETYGRGQRLHCDWVARTYCKWVREDGKPAFYRARSKCCGG